MSPHLSSTYLSTPTQYEHALLKIETRMQQNDVGSSFGWRQGGKINTVT